MERPAVREEEDHRARGRGRDRDRYPGPDLGPCPVLGDAHARLHVHSHGHGHGRAREVGHPGTVGRVEVLVEAEAEAGAGAGVMIEAGAGAEAEIGAEVEVSAGEEPKVLPTDQLQKDRHHRGHLLDWDQVQVAILPPRNHRVQCSNQLATVRHWMLVLTQLISPRHVL